MNDLMEQDTATAVDSGDVLPASHLLQYALDTGFHGTGTLVGSAGSYDSVAIQPADGKVVVAGISGSNLIVTRYRLRLNTRWDCGGGERRADARQSDEATQPKESLRSDNDADVPFPTLRGPTSLQTQPDADGSVDLNFGPSVPRNKGNDKMSEEPRPPGYKSPDPRASAERKRRRMRQLFPTLASALLIAVAVWAARGCYLSIMDALGRAYRSNPNHTEPPLSQP